LILKGPFLPTDAAFATLFSAFSKSLQIVEIEDGAKLGMNACIALSQCEKLITLQFRACPNVNDSELKILNESPYANKLQQLGLNRIGRVSSDILMNTIQTHSNLKSLQFSSLPNFSPDILLNMSSLHSLSKLEISDCPNVEDDIVVEMLRQMYAEGIQLTKVGFSRCGVSNGTLTALMELGKNEIEELDFNGCEGITESVLTDLGGDSLRLVRKDKKNSLNFIFQKSHLVKTILF